jgi:membrane associated rhomboid family serine protease
MNRNGPPAFNVPAVVLALLGGIVLIHAVRSVLPAELDFQFLIAFAFIPARFGGVHGDLGLPGGLAGDVWTWFSYAALHADAMHVTVNSIWFLAFGSAVARRFGNGRFLALSAAAAAAGAGAHLVSNWGDPAMMIGASAVVSAYMGAAIRFVFDPRIGIGGLGSGDARVVHAPVLPLARALRNRTVLAFVIVWFGVNFLFGLGAVAVPGASGTIAWQAHIGGFLVGLLGFRLFDPVDRSTSGGRPPPHLRAIDGGDEDRL